MFFSYIKTLTLKSDQGTFTPVGAQENHFSTGILQ